MRRVAGCLLVAVLVGACNSNIEIDLQGLEPLRALAPSELAPLGTGAVEAAGGTRPYRFEWADGTPHSGPAAQLDERRGSFRLGEVGRTTERIRVTDARGESQVVEVVLGEALAIDPPRTIVDPQALMDFDAVGGQPPYQFRIEGLSEDRIDQATGIFEAGVRGGRTVVVAAVDAHGAIARAEVRVSLTFSAGHAPLHAVALDVDRDGILDVAVASSADGRLELFQNEGGGQLRALWSVPLAAQPQALARADLDGDGLEDLLVAARAPDVLLVLLQDPIAVGGFREVIRHPLAAGATDVAVRQRAAGSFVAAASSDGGKAVEVVELAASGAAVSIASATRIPLSAGGTRVLIGDFVGDSELDLAVALTRPPPARGSVAYFAGGPGGFAATPAFEIEVGEGGGVAGINIGQGMLGGGPKEDIVASSSFSHELGIIIDSPGAGVPQLLRWPIPPGNGAHCAPCGRADDRACDPDNLCLALRAQGETQVCVRSCLDNLDCPHGFECQSAATADRVCTPPRSVCPVSSMIATGRNPRDVKVVDLDGDGVPELVTSTVNNTLEIYRRQQDDHWQLHQAAATGVNPFRLDVADFNGDGVPDLLVANRIGHSVTLLPGLGRLFSRGSDLMVGSAPGELVVAELDRDPKAALDVVVRVGDSFLTLVGDGRGGLSPYRRTAFAGGSSAPWLWDLDGDGHLDLFGFHSLDRTLEYMPWRAGVGFAGGPLTITGQQPVHLALGDMDADGQVDLVVANNLDRNFSLHRGDGTGAFAPYGPDAVLFDYAQTSLLSREVLALDGTLLFMSRDTTTSRLDVCALPVAAGTKASPIWTETVSGLATSLVPMDCDGDGRSDFAAIFTSVPQNAFDLRVYRRTASAFTVEQDLHTGVDLGAQGRSSTGPVRLVASDFTGDGTVDLVAVTRVSRELVLFRGDGSCRFSLAGRVSTGESLASAAAGDLDGDGLPDVVASVPPNRLAVFRNLGDRLAELQHYAPAGALCDPCDADETCGGDSDRCAGITGRRKVCARDCSNGRACPTGFRCDLELQQCLHEGPQCVR
jgi:hypothetical protein